MSTILLVLIYLVVTVAAQAFAGEEFLRHNKDDVLSALGTGRLRLAVRQAPDHRRAHLGLGVDPDDDPADGREPRWRWRASAPRRRRSGDIHPRYLTPGTSRPLLMGAVSLVWTLFIINVSQNVLGDSITGLGFQIAFYYGLTGFACAIYYRKELFKSAKNFFLVGVAPFLGGLMLTGIFIKAFIDNAPVDSAYSGGVFGLGAADAIGVGLLLVGVVLMFFASGKYPDFFKRKPEVADPGILEGTVQGEASVMAD